MDKFVDIRPLVFDGYLKTTVKFEDKVIVLKTLTTSEEDEIIEKYSHLPDEYNLVAVIDTIQLAIYSINSCKITDEARKKIRDWPKQIILRLFNEYIKLAKRVRDAAQLLKDFVKTGESQQQWSVIKATKTSFNSTATNVTQIQKIWIYLHEQHDIQNTHEIDWAKVEYMTESICSFVNPKAMNQINMKKKMEREEKERQKMIEEMKKQKGGNILTNTADDLFKAIEKKEDESRVDHSERVRKAVYDTLKEDEHDKFVREHEEYELARRLRIKKENHRRLKDIRKTKRSSVVIDANDAPQQLTRRKPPINVGLEQNVNVGEIQNKRPDIVVGFEQNVDIGSDEEFEKRIESKSQDNKYFVNGIDYSDIMTIKSFELLKSRDEIFNEVVNESDEETIKWIDIYIENEKEQTAVTQQVKDILSNSVTGDYRESMLNRREAILTGGEIMPNNSYENKQEQMKQQIQDENRGG